MTNPKRGNVYLVNFDSTPGAEIRKIRPALVLQNDVANRHSLITIVAAVTSHFGDRLYPTEVLIGAPEGRLSTDSVIFLNQIRSIDRRRFVKRLGSVNPETMTRVDQTLRVSLGLAGP